MAKSSLDYRQRLTPSNGLISQSLVIKKSTQYFGVECRNQSRKFDQFQFHPLYKFPVISRPSSSISVLQRSLFTISDGINPKKTLLRLHQTSPFANISSIREIIQGSSLAYTPEPTSNLKPIYELDPYQSSLESLELSELSSTDHQLLIPRSRVKTPANLHLDHHKEATLDTGLSFSSIIKSDEIVYNSDTIEVSDIEWDELKEKPHEIKDDDEEVLMAVDEGPRYSTTDHMFLSGETASKERLTRKKSVPIFKTRSLYISNDLSSPIIRKLVVCQESKEGKVVQSRETSVQVKSAHILKAISVSGYLSTPSISYSYIDNKSRGFIDYSDEVLLSTFLSNEIAASALKCSIELISCGTEHMTMLNTFGKVYSMGYGAGGVLGHGDCLSLNFPKQIESLSAVVYLECGTYHTAAVNESGEVFTWGRGDLGQLGLSQKSLEKDSYGSVSLVPAKVEDLSSVRIKSVACGQAHTLALDEAGNVYSFGWGDDGQLGLYPSELQANIMVLNVKRVNSLSTPAVKISAGANFSACVSSAGEVFIWGNGEKGQLGTGPKSKFSYFPTIVEALRKEDIIDLVCGEHHVFCISRSGKAFAWGLGIVDNLNDFDQYPKGSEIICYIPRILCDIEIAHRLIMIKPSVYPF